MRRVLVALAAVLAVAGAAATQVHDSRHFRVWAARAHVYSACGAPDCGSYPVNLHWDVTMAGVAGWYVFVDGVQVADVAQQSYIVYGLDCGSTYTLGVQAHGSGGTSQIYTSSFTTAACGAGSAPSLTAEPVISGTVATGDVLSVTNGSWSHTPTSYAYQWQDCGTDGTACSNIVGATSSTYTVASGDAGHTIGAVVTATNASGSTAANSPIVPLIDEFSGMSVDANVWKVLNQQGDTSNGEVECYETGQTTEGSGDLTEVLNYQSTAFACPGQAGGGGTPASASCTGTCSSIQTGGTAAHWQSGAVQEWSTAFTYGTIKVSAKLAGQVNQGWPAIWLSGAACQTSATSPFTFLSGVSSSATGFYCPWSSDASDAAEIDIMEGNSGNDTSYTMTEWNGGQVAHCTSGTISDYSSNFHTYELDWSAGSLTWKVDGTTECSSTTSVPSHPMFLIINTAAAAATQGAGGNTVVDFAHVSH